MVKYIVKNISDNPILVPDDSGKYFNLEPGDTYEISGVNAAKNFDEVMKVANGLVEVSVITEEQSQNETSEEKPKRGRSKTVEE